MQQTLRFLMVLVYGILAAYMVAWVVLSIACLRKRRFWPIFRSDKATKVFWLAALALLNPLLTGLYLVFGQLRRPDAAPGRIEPVQVGVAAIVIGIAGFFVNLPGLSHLWMVPFLGGDRGGGGDASFQANAATIESKNRASSTTVSNSGDRCGLACRRIAIVHESDGPLTPLVAQALRVEIAKLPFVEDVELGPGGRFPPSGTVRPDLFVLVSARDIQVTPIPYAVGLSAKIDILAGTTPWHGTSSYCDGSDLPELEFSIDSTIDHESKTVGFESVRHGLAAKNIAEQIAGELKTKFKAWLDKLGPMPDLPPAFQGDYRPSELPPPLAQFPNELIGSYSGLFTHNETYWRLHASGEDLKTLFERLETEMVAAGWKKISGDPGDLRMDNGPARINIFKRSVRVETGWTVATGKEVDARRPPIDLYVHYRERFGPEERKAAIESLLESDAPVASLVLPSRLMSADQRKRMIERLGSMPAQPLPALLEVVEFHLSDGRLDKADAAIRKARAELWATANSGDFTGRLEDAIKRFAEKAAAKAGLPKPAKAPEAPSPTAEDFRTAGFHEFPGDGQPVEFEVGLDEPAKFFQVRPDGRPRTIALTVTRPPGGTPANGYSSRFVEAEEGTRSWGESGGGVRDGRFWMSHPSKLGITVDLVEIDRKARFHVTARRSGSGEATSLAPAP